MSLVYGSVCSGVEAATLGWEPLGFRCAFVSEIDPQPCFVLHHRFGASRPRYLPDPAERPIKLHDMRAREIAIRRCLELPEHGKIINFGDFTRIRKGEHDTIDVLVGGTPCQSFSIAGLRGGMDDARGNLALEFLKLADRSGARWLVWENVPGVLSSNGGRDFGAIIGGMVELGYGVAWRILDAQYVRVDGLGRAVPQRRRRVFVVGHLGDWRRAAAVLFERASLLGDAPPRRESRQAIAGTITAGLGRRSAEEAERGVYIPELMAQALTSKIAKGSSGPAGDEHHHLIAHVAEVAQPIEAGANETGGDRFPGMSQQTAATQLIAFSHKDYGNDVRLDHAPTLRGMSEVEGHQNGGGQIAIAFSEAQITSPGNRSNPKDGDPSPTLASGGQPTAIAIQERATSTNPENGPDGVGVRTDGASYTLEARTVPQAVAFKPSHFTRSQRGGSPNEVFPPLCSDSGKGDSESVVLAQAFKPSYFTRGKDGAPDETVPPLSADADKGDQDTLALIGHNSAWRVRRLTPLECERLQGMPDNHTLVPYGRGMMADGPGYKMCGNSMAANVMRWIGQRIKMVEAVDD